MLIIGQGFTLIQIILTLQRDRYIRYYIILGQRKLSMEQSSELLAYRNIRLVKTTFIFSYSWLSPFRRKTISYSDLQWPHLEWYEWESGWVTNNQLHLPSINAWMSNKMQETWCFNLIFKDFWEFHMWVLYLHYFYLFFNSCDLFWASHQLPPKFMTSSPLTIVSLTYKHTYLYRDTVSWLHLVCAMCMF